jgi:hypothetical protein
MSEQGHEAEFVLRRVRPTKVQDRRGEEEQREHHLPQRGGLLSGT